ncbi:MAG: type II secretion system protein, partial [Planctomycetes bacterium]|nr:type II secretion system protein [Planctomycetota bacterium]
MNQKNQKHDAVFISPRHRGFTLIEVVVSIFILIILFSGILLAFQRTQEGVYDFIIRERAASA